MKETYKRLERGLQQQAGQTSLLMEDIAYVETKLDSFLAECNVHRQTDDLAGSIDTLTSRLNALEGQFSGLKNRYEVLMHTAFKIDPESVVPLLQPLKDRLQWLEEISGEIPPERVAEDEELRADVARGLRNLDNRIVDMDHDHYAPPT